MAIPDQPDKVTNMLLHGDKMWANVRFHMNLDILDIQGKREGEAVIIRMNRTQLTAINKMITRYLEGREVSVEIEE